MTTAEGATFTWSSLPSAELGGRWHGASAWTGKELVVWGGVNRSVDHVVSAMSDGAAFDPALGTWRSIASAPAGLAGSVQAAAWSGDELVVVANGVQTTASQGARYRPASDSWLPMAPSPLGSRSSAASVWTGGEVLVVGGEESQSLSEPTALAYSPSSDTWRTVGTPDFVPRRSVALVWTGKIVVAVGLTEMCSEPGPCTHLAPALASYDPATDAWTHGPADGLGPPDAPTYVYGFVRSAGWDGSSVVVTLRAPDRVLAIDPARLTATTGAPPACAATAATGKFDVPPILAGERLAWICPDGSVEGASGDLTSWTKLAAGPTSPQPVSEPVLRWTGRDLLLWGGLAQVTFNPTTDTGLRLTMARS